MNAENIVLAIGRLVAIHFNSDVPRKYYLSRIVNFDGIVDEAELRC